MKKSRSERTFDTWTKRLRKTVDRIRVERVAHKLELQIADAKVRDAQKELRELRKAVKKFFSIAHLETFVGTRPSNLRS